MDPPDTSRAFSFLEDSQCVPVYGLLRMEDALISGLDGTFARVLRNKASDSMAEVSDRI